MQINLTFHRNVILYVWQWNLCPLCTRQSHCEFYISQPSLYKVQRWHLWRSSLIVVRVLLYGANMTGNPLTVRGEILQTILVKSAPDLFRTKSVVFQTSQLSQHVLSFFYDTLIPNAEPQPLWLKQKGDRAGRQNTDRRLVPPKAFLLSNCPLKRFTHEVFVC